VRVLWRGPRVSGFVVSVVFLVLGGSTSASSLTAADATTTTILPIGARIDASPRFGPPGTVIAVRPTAVSQRCLGPFFAAVTFGATNDADVGVVEARVPGADPWTATLTVPLDTADGTYAIYARCATDATTIFRYFRVDFTVTDVPPTTQSSTSTTAPPPGSCKAEISATSIPALTEFTITVRGFIPLEYIDWSENVEGAINTALTQAPVSGTIRGEFATSRIGHHTETWSSRESRLTCSVSYVITEAVGTTTTTDVTSSSTMPSTTFPTAVAPAGNTTTSTVSSSAAELPRTGGSGLRGLIAIAGALFASGALFARSRLHNERA
jgi:hypothetical protein